MKITAPIILIADDDLDDLELLQEVLLQLNAETKVHMVTSGNEVAQFMDSCAPGYLPHLIVLDYNIPGMDGLEIFHTVRENSSFQNVPVVFWSTSSAPSLKAACEQAGAHAFVTKPTSIQGVKALAQQIMSICAV